MIARIDQHILQRARCLPPSHHPSATPATTTPPALPGLKDQVSVVRDRFGVPHISARNDHDVYFMQGYVHAGDRFFQMDASRRQASGTLAELLGPGALAGDVQLRTLGLRRAAARSLAAYPAEVQAISAGVRRRRERLARAGRAAAGIRRARADARSRLDARSTRSRSASSSPSVFPSTPSTWTTPGRC